MTKLENQLLDILREDCRIPLEKLAVMTGTDTVQVAEAIGADLKFGWPDAAVGHGTVEELEKEFGFDPESIAEAIWQSSMG